jgi:hypothetical protein
MRETITMMRMWAITKASRLKAVLSWTKTIWAMVMSIRVLRKSTCRSVRQSTRVKAMRNMRIRTRQEINKLITIWVSGILNTPPLNFLTSEAKLIHVTSTATKHAHKSFLSRLGGLSLHTSLGVEGWLWIGWVMGFDWFEYFLFFIVAGARNKLRSTLLILFLTSLKPNPQFVFGFDCTLLNPAHLLNHFLAQNGFFKMCSQINNLLLQLDVLFGSMEKLTLERETYFTRRG